MGAPLALNEFRLKIQKSAALTNNFFFLFYLAGKKKAKNKVSCRLFKNTTWFLFKKSRIFKLRTGLNSLRFKTTDTHRISLYKKTRSSSLGAQNSRCRLSYCRTESARFFDRSGGRKFSVTRCCNNLELYFTGKYLKNYIKNKEWKNRVLFIHLGYYLLKGKKANFMLLSKKIVGMYIIKRSNSSTKILAFLENLTRTWHI